MSEKNTFFKSLISLVTLVSLLLLLAGAATLGIMHSHDCVGEECEICMALNSVKDLLDGILLAGVFSFAAFRFLSFFVELLHSEKFIIYKNLISLKVKLSD